MCRNNLYIPNKCNAKKISAKALAGLYFCVIYPFTRKWCRFSQIFCGNVGRTKKKYQKFTK